MRGCERAGGRGAGGKERGDWGGEGVGEGKAWREERGLNPMVREGEWGTG